MIWKAWVFISLISFSVFSWAEKLEEGWVTCRGGYNWLQEKCVEINKSRALVILYTKEHVEFIFLQGGKLPNIRCEKDKLEEGRRCEG